MQVVGSVYLIPSRCSGQGDLMLSLVIVIIRLLGLGGAKRLPQQILLFLYIVFIYIYIYRERERERCIVQKIKRAG